ncbi:NADH-quinone oxidoreductase subunit M [Desulfopila sp. IMCC35006]|uniref:complex I subunit 4 family protein n=1 Tax=Desulfopila sp. IMCC35006 TaxID=2569542 RepID=UPI0010ACC80D|nr:NADH-quinone oxidoreductase subunit M [Desulfopila sp. IMCC35006]TKB26154.1 NADH-quinone oxidoreductase subunit M [Desulfopila sp. IMCC35006]
MFEYALSVMIFLPILGGLAMLLMPISRGASRITGLIVSLVVLLMGIELFLGFTGTGGMEYLENRPWIESLGISYGLGVDGISLLVLMTGAVLFPMVFAIFTTQSKGYYANLLIAQGAMIGAICATDLVLFYIFWEIMLLPIFFMIGIYGGPKRLPATLKITIYTIAGSLLMLAALVYVGVSYHNQFGKWTFDIVQLGALDLGGGFAILAFLMFMVAFAIKIPLFPFHTWLPDAYTEAPTATTFVLSAIMAKIGVYGVIRFVIPVFEVEFVRFAVLLSLAGVVGMMYCGLAAIAQKDMKRMLAFSSASHMGIIAVGVFCMNTQALTGSLFQIAAHATSTGVLFLFVGLMEERMGTREIGDLGGIAYRAPIFATFFAIAMLASVGLPGTSGFIGEFLIILGAIKFSGFIGFLAGTSLIIGVCYMLWMFQRVFFEKENDRTAAFPDLNVREILTFLPVILLIIGMGIFPQTFIKKIEPAAQLQIAKVFAMTQSQVAETTVPKPGHNNHKN